jgi:F420-non-reducing hydrogenase iron-sulfur subunit
MNIRALKTYVFYCSNNIDKDQLVKCCRGIEDNTVKTISLPCSGKVDVFYLIKAFETGADGVVIITCRKDECRHLEGSMRAQKRAAAVESLLEEIGIGAGRMAVIECEKNGFEQSFGEIKQFFGKVRNLPQLSVKAGAVN